MSLFPEVTRVVNRHRDRYDVYVGRPGPWGNPFVIGKDGTRDEVIEKFREYGERVGLRARARAELRGKTLGCWCSPERCHGDVLAEWANE